MISMLQIHPTLECNRNCSFCSYRNNKYDANHGMEAHGEAAKASPVRSIPFSVIIKRLKQVAWLGCKALKVSGGGEPLLYQDIIPLLCMAKELKLKIYLQTNGILLNNIYRSLCNNIRVSCGDGIPFEAGEIKPDGYSYIITSKPDYANLNRLMEYATHHDLYVRVAFDDTDTNTPGVEEILHHIPSLHIHKGAVAIPITHKHTLWDNSITQKGQNPCPSSIKTPLLGADGHWYPCCRTQFALEHKVWGYNKKMRMGMGMLPLKPYDGSSCVNCSYDLSN